MSPGKLQVTADNRDELRYRCLTDLYFLARDVLGYDKVIERTHRVIAEFFVQKKPRLPLEEQDTIRERMLLYPRYSYKSTFNIADTIQWILNFPEIVIFPITAAGELGEGFVKEIQEHMMMSGEDAEPRPIEKLFPEFMVKRKKGVNLIGKYTAPCRQRPRKEPTILALSPGMNINGWHCDIMKEDDCVNAKNSRTERGLRATVAGLAETRDMLYPLGYNDHVGTPHSPLDAHMHDLRTAPPGKMKVLRAPAWRVKKESRWKLKDRPEPLDKEDYEYLFPELLSYEFLVEKMRRNYKEFCSQYLLDPVAASGVTFTPEMLDSATVEARQTPTYGETRVCFVVREAVAGVAAIYEGGRMFVVDQVEGRFLPSQLAKRMAQMARKWGVHDIQILRTVEGEAVAEEARLAGWKDAWPLDLHWIEADTADSVTQGRIRAMEAQLTARKIVFNDRLPGLEALKGQFEQFMILEHKEIPEAIAQLARWLPRYDTAEMKKQQDDRYAMEMKRLRDKDQYERVNQIGRYTPQEPVEPEVERADDWGVS